VVAAVRIGNRRWDIIFEGGIRVYLPEINMSKAWSRLASANLENNFFDSDVKVIDLRFPDRMILRINTNKIDNEKTT
jgi:Cell division septal protein